MIWWLPDLQSIFVPVLHCHDPLSQWKTHLGLITWARLLPLSYFLSLKRHFLSFTPSLFYFTLSLSFSLWSLVSSLLMLQLQDQGSPALAVSQNTHTCRTSNTLVWPRGHRYTSTMAFRCCIVISSGSAIGERLVLISWHNLYMIAPLQVLWLSNTHIHKHTQSAFWRPKAKMSAHTHTHKHIIFPLGTTHLTSRTDWTHWTHIHTPSSMSKV